MGEAKRRGTYEQRKAEGIEKRSLEDEQRLAMKAAMRKAYQESFHTLALGDRRSRIEVAALFARLELYRQEQSTTGNIL